MLSHLALSFLVKLDQAVDVLRTKRPMADEARSEQAEREQMMQPMLVACPSFQPAWQAFVAEWEEDPLAEQDGLPTYLALGDLAQHLVRKLEVGDTADFPAVFDVVERWHRQGTHTVKEAATVGLLEGLQNTNLYAWGEPEGFLPWLQPETRRWWDKVERFWSHGELLRDD